MEKPLILYVEDDETLKFITTDNLEREQFNVVAATDGKVAWELFRQQTPDICVLDVNLPRMDGFTLARKIREANQDVPIIFVTAKSLKEDKLEGLLLGGDDYLIKPFSIEELILKIRIFLRRSKTRQDPSQQIQITFGSYTLHPTNLMLTSAAGDIKLTYREAELLNYFLKNQEVLLGREQILDSVWGGNDYFAGRSLDVYISRLRKYLSADPDIKIENRHGIGFQFIIKHM
ncbi:MAG: response regulator transcription factor [Bacteroidia bacterium]|nr:response regulator transcription factor [Bacteroidia bacterium]